MPCLFFNKFQAAILQQTAQYIIDLEREKTQLLTQNCHLKRLMDQQEGGGVVEVAQPPATTQTQSTLPNKKRKLDSIYTVQTISDSSDEGLGSMSPEPTMTLVSAQTTQTAASANTKTSNLSINAKEYIEMKNFLDIERRKNLALEERLRQLECHPVYTTSDRITYQHQEVIEHTDNLRAEVDDDDVQTVMVDKIHHNMQNVHVLQLDTIPTVGQTQVVVCSPIDEDHELIEHETVGIIRSTHIDDEDDDDSRTMSPLMMNSAVIKEEVIMTDSRPNSPMDSHHLSSHHLKSNGNGRLQPILEAAIKAEPKVEVERISSPNSITVLKDCTVDNNTIITSVPPQLPCLNGAQASNNRTASRMYLTNTSRQNLETIVEAIRHLEGDQMFGEIVESEPPTQEVPLALTNKPQRQLQMEMNSFLQFRSGNSPSHVTATTTTPSAVAAASHTNSPLLHAQLQHPQCINIIPQQSGSVRLTTVSTAAVSTPSHIQSPHPSINNRPGVIVVKQHS